jgi:hypothetical protein
VHQAFRAGAWLQLARRNDESQTAKRDFFIAKLLVLKFLAPLGVKRLPVHRLCQFLRHFARKY